MPLNDVTTLTRARLLGISFAAGFVFFPGHPGHPAAVSHHAAVSRATRALVPRVEHRLARWPDGGPRLETTVANDAYEGEYRTWYRSGAAYELRHFLHGREEGLQQSWTESGALFLNYEVRNGRRYGFINARPCLPVELAEPVEEDTP